jgi:hypothetical protein
MYTKHLFIVIILQILLLFPLTRGAGQEPQASPIGRSPAPKLVVKFSPTALLEIPQPALQFALEYAVAPLLSLQHEIGWMPYYSGINPLESGSRGGGYKVKSELRLYSFGFNAGESASDQEMGYSSNKKYMGYFAFELFFRSRVVYHQGWYRMDRGNFSQFLELEQHRRQMGFHFKVGRQIRLSQSAGIFIDSYAGLGLRRFYAIGQITTSELQGTPDNLRTNYNFVLPSITLGFKFGIGY